MPPRTSLRVQRDVPEGEVQRGTVRRKLGTNLAEQIYRLTVSSVLNGVLELLTNPYDADASEVHVEYRPEDDFLSIGDNGCGMSPDNGLSGFYGLGDSQKQDKKRTPKYNRTPIGDRGVGTAVLKALCSNYDLLTTRDNLETRVREIFAGQLDSTTDIPYVTTPIDNDGSGTLITMRGLKFKSDRGFNLERLKREIPWNLPLDANFTVYVNGTKLTERSITHDAEFRIQHTDTLVGTMSGSFYLTKAGSSQAGIHVFVNGRRVGRPESFVALDLPKESMRNRLVGLVYADGLAPIVNYGREEFLQDPQGLLVRMQEVIKPVLSQVRSYLESSAGAKVAKKKSDVVNSLLSQLRARLMKDEESPINKSTTIEFFNYGEGTTGTYNTQKNLLSLNGDNPLLILDPVKQPEAYGEALLSLAVDTLAVRAVDTDGEFSFVDLLDARDKIYSKIRTPLPGNETAQAKLSKQLHGLKMYSFAEASNFLEIPIGGIRYLARGGFAPDEENLTGADILSLHSRLRGYRSLYDVVHEHAGDITTIQLQRSHDLLATVGEQAVPLVKNIAANGVPCYIVDAHCAAQVWQTLSDIDLRTGDDPQEKFAAVTNEFVLLDNLMQRFALQKPQADAVLAYSVQKSMPLRSPKGWKLSEPRKVRFGDFVAAYQGWSAQQAT